MKIKIRGNKGFTLIELLSVIVVLAIIALIATPIVMNLIEKSQKEAVSLSIASIEKAAGLYFYNAKISGNSGITEFTCEDGVCSNGSDILEIDGTGPDSGTIIIDKDGNILISSIVIDGYACIQEPNQNACKTVVKLSDLDNKVITDGLLTLEDTDGMSLVNYKIEGNSIQNTYKGKQLYDINKVDINVESSWKWKIGEDGWVTASKDNTSGTTTSFGQFFTDTDSLNLNNSTDYYIIIEVAENQNTQCEWIGDTNVNTYFNDKVTYNGISSCDVGTFIVKKTTRSDFSDVTQALRQYFYVAAGKSAKIKFRFSIYQQATTTNNFVYEPYVGGSSSPNPDYPQEVISVGDLVTDENNPNYGKYRIPIRVMGKNLIDDTKKFVEYKYAFYLGTSSLAEYVTLDAGTYTLSVTTASGKPTNLYVEDFDATTRLVTHYTTLSTTFTLDKRTNVRMWIWDQNFKSTDDILTAQLERGEKSTSYEPHKQILADIYLDEPLRKVHSSVDYIDLFNKKLVRNTGEYVFTGSERWSSAYGSYELNGSSAYRYGINTLKETTGLNLYTNVREVKVMSNQYKYAYIWNSTVNHTYQTLNTIYVFNRISSLDEFKQELAENPLKVYFQLESPVVQTISLPNIELTEGYSAILVDTEVKPSKITYSFNK